MIKTENTYVNGRTLVRTYSDANRMIRQDGTGNIYSEAVDPVGSGRTYTETEEEIPTATDDADYKTAFEILIGGIEV